MPDHPPLDAAGYAAGEGGPRETLEFDERLSREPGLRDEVDFWKRLRPALAPGEVPPAPDLSAAILRRATLERRDPRPVRTPRWVAPTAVAALLLVGMGGWTVGRISDPPAPTVEVIDDPVAYAEDGSGIMPPPAEAVMASYLPLASAHAIETGKPRVLPESPKPWIGLWTRPARLLVRGESQQDAHLVMRVVGGSPAWQAGIRPGDMLLTFNGCPLKTPVCLAHALSDCKPGDSVPVTFWSGEKGSTVTTTVTLEVVHD
jgi:hypothetical protein